MRNFAFTTVALAMTLTSSALLLGCDDSKKGVIEEVASDITADAATAVSPEPENQPVAVDVSGEALPAEPVNYDVSSWSNEAVSPITFNDLDEMKAALGKVVTTDDNSLDYASNIATKYRFMSDDAPYLDLIDSDKYLEIGWYFANPNDSDKEKEISKSHAKHVYTLARKLMGEDGGRSVADILGGQVIKNKVIGGQKIELAKCEFYSCMLILNKAAG